MPGALGELRGGCAGIAPGELGELRGIAAPLGELRGTRPGGTADGGGAGEGERITARVGTVESPTGRGAAGAVGAAGGIAMFSGAGRAGTVPWGTTVAWGMGWGGRGTAGRSGSVTASEGGAAVRSSSKLGTRRRRSSSTSFWSRFGVPGGGASNGFLGSLLTAQMRLRESGVIKKTYTRLPDRSG